jgi:hypothetical protein
MEASVPTYEGWKVDRGDFFPAKLLADPLISGYFEQFS